MQSEAHLHPQHQAGAMLGPAFKTMLGGKDFLPNGSVTALVYPIAETGVEFLNYLHRLIRANDPRGADGLVLSFRPTDQDDCLGVAERAVQIAREESESGALKKLALVCFFITDDALNAEKESVFTIQFLRQFAQEMNIPVVVALPGRIEGNRRQSLYEITLDAGTEVARQFDLELFVYRSGQDAWEVVRGKHRLAAVEQRPMVDFSDQRIQLALV